MNRRACPAALLALLVAATPAPAQQGQPHVPYEGYQTFLRFLNQSGLKPLANAAALADVEPRETLVVVLGSPAGLDRVIEMTGGLQAFRTAGGAVLVATDLPDRGRLRDLGVRVDGRGVEVLPAALEKDPGLAYQGNPAWPVLRHVFAEHPIFRGVPRPRLATNQPSFLRRLPDCDLHALATFSPGWAVAGAPVWAHETAFMAGTLDGPQPGKVLVVAGHNLFWNGTLAASGTDNFVFAAGAVRWLSDGGRRKHALVIADGSVAADFDVPLTQIPVPPPKVIAGLIRWLENKNFFNRLALDNLGRDTILRPLAVVVSLGLALYALYRLVRAHHGGEPAPPPVAVKVAEQASELPVLVRRQRFLLEERNCYEAARELARLCFEGVAGAARPPGPPRALRGGRKLQRQADRLWRLAYGDEPEPVSPAELASLSVMMARVRSALARGEITNDK